MLSNYFSVKPAHKSFPLKLKLALAFLFVCLSFNTLTAQVSDATGRYIYLEQDPNLSPNLFIGTYVGSKAVNNVASICFGVEFEYFKSEKFSFGADIAALSHKDNDLSLGNYFERSDISLPLPMSIELQANYWFYSKDVKQKKSFTVDRAYSTYSDTKFVIKPEYYKRKSFGLHGGYFYFGERYPVSGRPYAMMNVDNRESIILTGKANHNIFLGIGRAIRYNLLIDSEDVGKRNHRGFGNMYLDLILPLVVRKDLAVQVNGGNAEPVEDFDRDVPLSIGWRFTTETANEIHYIKNLGMVIGFQFGSLPSFDYSVLSDNYFEKTFYDAYISAKIGFIYIKQHNTF